MTRKITVEVPDISFEYRGETFGYVYDGHGRMGFTVEPEFVNIWHTRGWATPSRKHVAKAMEELAEKWGRKCVCTTSNDYATVERKVG